MEKPEFSRRDLLKGAAALGAAAALPQSADAQERRNNFEENGLYLNIKAFEKLPGNVLVLCANSQEYRQVMETIRSRDRLRSAKGKFKFETIKRGSCEKVSGDIRDFSGGADTGSFNNRAMHILHADNPDFTNTYLNNAKSSTNGGFSMVQLRGHTQDMHPLFEASKKFQAPACFLSLGGCEGTQLIKEFYKPERPVSAESDIGTTVNNTQLLVRYFDELGSGKHASWLEFYQAIARTSSNVASGRMIVPGDPRYKEYI